MKKFFKDIQKYLLSGVSYMMPVVVAGGVILAVSLLGAEQTEKGLVPANAFMQFLNVLGKDGLAMMIPVFAAYICYSMAGKPGLTPGFVLGYLANNTISINIVKWMKGWKVPKAIKAVMPIIIIPVLTVLAVGTLYYFVLGYPISALVNALLSYMNNLSTTSAIGLAMFMGVFAEIDFGGPVTKAVSMFTLALINDGVYWPNGIFRVLVSIPPIGVFLGTVLARHKFSQEEKDNAKAAGIMGVMGITEGTIPFAIAHPKAVYPASIAGSIVGALIALAGKVECPVPHGGFIVLPVVTGKGMYSLAIIAGSLVTGLVLSLLMKKPADKPETESASQN